MCALDDCVDKVLCVRAGREKNAVCCLYLEAKGQLWNMNHGYYSCVWGKPSRTAASIRVCLSSLSLSLSIYPSIFLSISDSLAYVSVKRMT